MAHERRSSGDLSLKKDRLPSKKTDNTNGRGDLGKKGNTKSIMVKIFRKISSVPHAEEPFAQELVS